VQLKEGTLMKGIKALFIAVVAAILTVAGVNVASANGNRLAPTAFSSSLGGYNVTPVHYRKYRRRHRYYGHRKYRRGHRYYGHRKYRRGRYYKRRHYKRRYYGGYPAYGYYGYPRYYGPRIYFGFGY